MDDRERVARIQRILECSGALFQNLSPGRDRAWFSVELTMPQLKTLMFVASHDGATSGQIAKRLGVGLSTVTGIVDRLTDQEFVTRSEDPEDRRVTRVLPTATGKELVDHLSRYKNELVSAILSRLDSDQLKVVEAAFTYLVEASFAVADERDRKENAA